MTNYAVTHWFGCWRDHHDCAKALVERSATLLDRLIPLAEVLPDMLLEELKQYEQMVNGPKWEVVSEVSDPVEPQA